MTKHPTSATATRRLRVLALTHRVPYPPDKGDKIRTFHLLSRLARHTDVHLVCFADPPEDLQHRSRLESVFASVHIVPLRIGLQKVLALPHLVSTKPLTLPIFERRAMHDTVARVIEDTSPDVTYAESSSMAPYALEHPSVPLVMDFVDMDSEKWRACATGARGPAALVYAREAWALARFERHVAHRARICAVTAPRERAALERIAPGVLARVLPNGVDTEYFIPRTSAPSRSSLVFFGAMDYLANVEAAAFLVRQVLPRVRARVPGTTVTLAGARPSREVRVLASIDGVTVTGFVSDIRPHVQDAMIAVCPLRVARGVQNKVLEAMAMGVPVVATEAAAEGITADHDHEIVVAPYDDDGCAVADAVVSLLTDPAHRHAIARAARTRVVEMYSWEPRAAELLSWLGEAASFVRTGDAAPDAISP